MDKQLDIIHYFPPNIEKIGDNILTFGIARQLAGNSELYYYCNSFVSEILISLYNEKNISFVVLDTIENSFILASILRNSSENVVDLQQLNCLVDYPHYNYLFDDEINERAKYDWLNEYAVNRWGLQRFENIFRSILQIPPAAGRISKARKETAFNPKILLFPHCETLQQQYANWNSIIEMLEGITDQYNIVGKKERLKELLIVAEDRWLEAGSGSELIKIISEACMCIGGATGLSHISCELEIPTFLIWCYNDYEIFKPLNEDRVEVLFNENWSEQSILKKILLFIERYSRCL